MGFSSYYWVFGGVSGSGYWISTDSIPADYRWFGVLTSSPEINHVGL